MKLDTRVQVLWVSRIHTGPVRNEIVDAVVVVEVERLKGVEDEVTHVLVHVGAEDAAVKVVDGSTSIHHLQADTPVLVSSQHHTPPVSEDTLFLLRSIPIIIHLPSSTPQICGGPFRFCSSSKCSDARP